MSGHLVWLAIIGCVVPVCVFSQDDPNQKTPLLQEMDDRARETEVVVRSGMTETTARRHSRPVFRYSDVARRIEDATLWIWTIEGRPVALQKIELSGRKEKEWTFCFASLTDGTVTARWPDGREFQTTRDGVTFKRLNNAPSPAEAGTARSRQLRELARRFSARLTINPAKNVTEELRLLPRPVFEYGSTGTAVLSGAVFGFAASGTNPDAYLLLQLVPDGNNEPEWQYAWARMTTGGLEGRLDGEEVWSANFVPPRPMPFETWTFFFRERQKETPRQP